MTDEEIKLDLLRTERIGLGEAVFCAQKSISQIERILEIASDAGSALLLTRLDPDMNAAITARLRDDLDYDPVSQTAFFRHIAADSQPEPRIVIVAAGTSDAGPAREAMRTLAFNNEPVTIVFDVGVAGLWRLMDRLDEIRRHDVIIAVAGMDAALVSVLGGLVAQPLIAVPTSTGYGAARQGETALAASLASCAAGVTVCNIDNGYGAACAALRILGRIHAAQHTDASEGTT
ncbi:MAG: nickel pincer cofactor biosynthesis protein LarB [Hyphomicrobiaceae bacterium]